MKTKKEVMKSETAIAQKKLQQSCCFVRLMLDID